MAEAAEGCDAIVNFAAETHVDRSILGPAEFIQTNVAGTQVLLDHAPQRIRLVHVSTDEVYGDVAEGTSSVEDDPLRPSSPYSAAKAGGDLQVLGLVRTRRRRADHTRLEHLRPFQYPEKLLPLFVTNALDGEPLPVRRRRPGSRLAFVDDHCAGVELALRGGRAGEVYNIGGGEEATNREITISSSSTQAQTVRSSVEDRAGHDRRYSLDTTKARTGSAGRPARCSPRASRGPPPGTPTATGGSRSSSPAATGVLRATVRGPTRGLWLLAAARSASFRSLLISLRSPCTCSERLSRSTTPSHCPSARRVKARL